MSTENNEIFIDADIIERVKTLAHISTDKDFADILGISSADFGQRKKRGTLLPLITRWAIKRDVDLNYLLKGYSLKSTANLDPDPEIADLMRGAQRVLTSGNPIAFDALERNIRYFDHAINAEKQLNEMKSDVEMIKEELKRLKRENLRLDAEAEEQLLKKKVA
jgi:hypothetical protein